MCVGHLVICLYLNDQNTCIEKSRGSRWEYARYLLDVDHKRGNVARQLTIRCRPARVNWTHTLSHHDLESAHVYREITHGIRTANPRPGHDETSTFSTLNSMYIYIHICAFIYTHICTLLFLSLNPRDFVVDRFGPLSTSCKYSCVNVRENLLADINLYTPQICAAPSIWGDDFFSLSWRIFILSNYISFIIVQSLPLCTNHHVHYRLGHKIVSWIFFGLCYFF